MLTNPPIVPNLETVKLNPSFTIPLVLIFAAIPLLLLQVWLSLTIGLFGFFLLVQALTIRLEFTADALDIYRLDKLIRSFPYSEWQHYEIFYPSTPILFYFREVKSIHFLPIIFDAKMLATCLEDRCPRLK